MQSKIQVGIIEDQLLFREGMKAILAHWPEFELVFECAEGYTAVEKLRTCTTLPHVMLVDLSLPPQGLREFSGLHVTLALTEAFPDMKILILSVHEDENFITQLIEHGAHGYLVKDVDPSEVHDAIVSVHQKGAYVNMRTLKALQHNTGKKMKTVKLSTQITRREEEILQLICQQYTAEEIAEKLFISVKTVNGHRNNLLQKTGSRNVTGLVLYALRNHVITLS